ncbi:glycosyltransferase [Chlorogloeopsis fritschii PCC 9212]|uniref:Colanic acid biosynthesis glycosyltransferase WcaL n=1 Tax=Chlorogloeopsis fritschii PCC 6912 TaxID=211165 RepID=A0A433NHK6_CHLFR|nr:glycosyltransferase [Chlorogloeopsis fritschii]RUR81862.1 colanic acid biosynthesis glycosyltransferase WcaL [Chlorogloeopsis fritschii PCC 6912]
MQIAFIVWEFPILSETFILNQIVGLIKRGHEVDIYASQQGDISKVHPDVTKYQLLERTYYLNQIPKNLLWRFVKGIGLLCVNFYKDPLLYLRSLNFFKYGKEAISLWLLYTAIPLLQKSYDIIHCQFGTQSFSGMAFRHMNAPKAKLITTFRGHDISSYVQQRGDRIYSQLFRSGDFFLANCEYFRQRAIALGCDPNKIVVHGSGIDCSCFRFAPRYPHPDGKVRIATTGRLVEKKGIEYSIRAVAKLAKTNPNIEYNIIGDGPLKQELQELIQELDVSHIVNLLGQKNQQELIEILDNSHIFTAPCVTAKDGNQDAPVNVLKEAMAMGLPVVSTLHGGVPELVEDGVSGFLVPERDVDALAEKLGYLIEHSEIWPQMGKSGRAYVEKHYDIEKLNDELVEIYYGVANYERRTSYDCCCPARAF